jgi:predicted ATPase
VPLDGPRSALRPWQGTRRGQIPTVVVLNEPETSLHVALLPALARLVVAASEQTQIVLTTHSSVLAESLLARESALGYELQLVGGSTTVTKLV